MEKNFNEQENNNVQNDIPTNKSSSSTQYQQVTYNVPVNVSVGEWMITKLILCVPLVGFIMLFVWAFGGGTNISKQNWAKAELIWILIFIILSFLFWVLIVGVSLSSIGSIFRSAHYR